MNGQLPPVDPVLRENLARRSSGRLPEDLTTQVLQAVDAAPVKPRYAWRAFSPRPAHVVRRTLLAGASLAVVVLLAAALVVVPRFQTTPASGLAGYPAERALTTAGLASLMAGPALPVNSTLVASVTIDAKTDVCPMNSRPTIGVVEGMGSQVCVMGSSVSEYLEQAASTGTFAFRYMAPGYLGLVGEITPASSRLAFHVTDEWPRDGKPFLVEGYLGENQIRCTTTETFPPGDSLNPSGYEPCQLSWLSDDGSPVPLRKAAVSPGESGDFAVPPDASVDLLALHERARYVSAGGARQLDSIPSEMTQGVYVVRQVTGPCPGASPVDSRGCSVWQVMARVSDVAVPESSPSRAPPTPTPTTAPPATPLAPMSALPIAATGLIGPANRALAPTELSDLIAADPHYFDDRYVIDERVVCDGMDCTGFPPKPVADSLQNGGQVIGLVGPLEIRPDGSLVYTVPQVLAAGFVDHVGATYVVDAWITGLAADSCDVSGQPCYEVSWLGPEAGGSQLNAQLGAYHRYGAGAVGGGTPIHGLFLVQTFWDAKLCYPKPLASSGECSAQVQILARLEPAVLP